MERLPVTHGESRHLLSTQQFTLTWASYAPGMTVARHRHEHASWTYVAEGAFAESFGARRVEVCRQGTMISKPAHAAHENHYGLEGASCLLIEVAASNAFTPATHARIFGRVAAFPNGRVPTAARRILREIEAGDSATALGVTALLFEIAALLTRASFGVRTEPVPPWLLRVRDRLSEEFRSPPTLDSLAREADVHPTYLCHAFRAAFHTSPGEFSRAARARWARGALIMTDVPLASIAIQAGYSDQSHLTRQFRRYFGQSPAAYRLRHMRP